MRYLDQECEQGEDAIRLPAHTFSRHETYGYPSGVSFRDFGMAVTSLRVDVGDGADFARLREHGHDLEIVVVRGGSIIATWALWELPIEIAGLPRAGTGPYGISPPSPYPVYLYNPPRQNLSFATRGTLPVPVALRFWWSRLERISTLEDPRPRRDSEESK